MTTTISVPRAAPVPPHDTAPVSPARVRGAGVRAPTVAAGVAIALASLALAPLLDSLAWYPDTLLVILVVTVVGGLATSARVPVVLIPLLQAVALLSTLVSRFTSEAPFDLVPSPDAVAALRDVFRDGTEAMDRYAPPAPVSEGISAVIALGIGCVALVVFVLAVNLRMPALAGAPLFALYVVPSALLDDGSPWWAFVCVVAGWLLLLVTDERVSLQGWGRLLRRSDDSFGTSPLTMLSSAALRLGAVAVVTAIALPVIIPGLADAVLGRARVGGGPGSGEGPAGEPDSVGVDPFVSLRRDLLDQPNVTVMTYRNEAGTPTFLRSVVLEDFDGDTWRPREFSPDNAVPAADGPFADPSVAASVTGVPQRYLVTSNALRASWLPVPEHATSVSVDDDWFVDHVTGTVFSDRETVPEQTWVVDAQAITPTPAELRAAPDISPEDQGRLKAATPISATLASTARTVTAGTTTKYDAAVAIQRWLNAFTYSTAGVQRSQSASYLEQFLLDRKGYCEQFAATMALMAIELGIPARVVVGFTSGTLRSPGEWTVAARDAHAWPELFFSGVGWVRFEPTPSGGGTTFQTPVWTETSPDDPGAGSTATPGVSRINPFLFDEPGADLDGGDLGVADFEVFNPADNADAWRKRALLVLAVVALVLAAVPGVIRWRRRRRRTSAQAGVEDAWAELRDTMRDLGMPWSDADTPRQAAAGVIATQRLAGDDAAAVTRLGRAVEQTRYAPNPGSVTGVRRDLETVRAALIARVDRPVRLRAALLPQSLRTSTAPAG